MNKAALVFAELDSRNAADAHLICRSDVGIYLRSDVGDKYGVDVST